MEHDAPEKLALLDEINLTVDTVPEFVVPVDSSICSNDATYRIRKILEQVASFSSMSSTTSYRPEGCD